MSNDAAHLVDEVLPDVAVRQWVLPFPFRIRYLLAYDSKLCCAVRRIFVRSVQGFFERQAREQLYAGARGGAVVFVQQIGRALNLNLLASPMANSRRRIRRRPMICAFAPLNVP